jgi:hypothetical protein
MGELESHGGRGGTPGKKSWNSIVTMGELESHDANLCISGELNDTIT